LKVFGSSNRNSDKVAADIGFALDGSAPNPIISGVMFGIGRTSMGTGYIVENIKSDKPAHLGKGYFVNKIVVSLFIIKLLVSPSPLAGTALVLFIELCGCFCCALDCTTSFELAECIHFILGVITFFVS
jgi:hypothetical protein